MAFVTTDIPAYTYGVPENNLVSYGIGATQQLYVGAIALVSGSGSVTQGYLKNAATPGTADLVAGLVGGPAGGTQVQTGPGVVGGTADGNVWADVRTGSFMFQNSALAPVTMTNVGKTVYYEGENANGPIVRGTSTGGYPSLGVLLPQDPGFLNNYIPGSNYWPVKLNTIGGP